MKVSKKGKRGKDRMGVRMKLRRRKKRVRKVKEIDHFSPSYKNRQSYTMHQRYYRYMT